MSSVGTASWSGIPIVNEINMGMIATLSPGQHDDILYNVLSVFDRSDPHNLIKVASVPIDEYSADGGNDFNLTCMAYDAAWDTLTIVRSSMNHGSVVQMKQVKLMKSVVEEGKSYEEIPTFVKSVPFPAGMKGVNAIHLTEDHSVFFLGDQSYRVLTHNSTT